MVVQGLRLLETHAGLLHSGLLVYDPDVKCLQTQCMQLCQWTDLPEQVHQWPIQTAKLPCTFEDPPRDSAPVDLCEAKAGPVGRSNLPAFQGLCSTTSAGWSGGLLQGQSCVGQTAMSTACTDPPSHESQSFAPCAHVAPSSWKGLVAQSSLKACARTLHCPPDPDLHSIPAQVS